MRLGLQKSTVFWLLGLLLVAPPLRGQNADTLDPVKSEAKAKQLLKQALQALGGVIYANSVESDCEGRVAQLDRNGSLMGLNNIHSYWRYPDKNRTEYIVKSTKGGIFAVLVGNLPVKGGAFIQVFDGDRGWTMDKSGVNEADATAIGEFQNSMKRQIHNILLDRVKEEGTYLQYSGLGVVDLHPVDWVEMIDKEERKVRLALDHDSHLPLRTVVITPNEEMHDMDEDVIIYTNYQINEGVQTPLQVTREHNGRRTYQIFYNSCKVSPNLPADFFSEASLQERYKKTGGKAPQEK